ncbi:unnamed protein product [Vicia faba]|uniref:Transmembrane protein n=1 Tax=Vicia faba TaxID=3906 RepID=A0AAV1AZ89_VICFA|nr:unnamed protein product [Vicia faba]
MNSLIMLQKNPTFIQPGWDIEEIHATFFKCISWQMEENFDTINCPYHYVCDKTYPPNYPLFVDILVLVFTTCSYFFTLVIVIMNMISRKEKNLLTQSKRFLLPSGPISLPLIILIFAKGHQINTIFPLSCFGPAILLLVLTSSLSFDNEDDYKDIKYTFFAASTVSGILHASLYLDSIVLPYYTGYDALMSSTVSGECATCVCRKEALVVGGKLVKYKGWSVTTFFVVGVLCLRIICKIYGENVGKFVSRVKVLMERLSWVLISLDCVYLMVNLPHERVILRVVVFGGVFVLILLHVLKEASSQMYMMVYVVQNLRLGSMPTPIQTA